MSKSLSTSKKEIAYTCLVGESLKTGNQIYAFLITGVGEGKVNNFLHVKIRER